LAGLAQRDDFRVRGWVFLRLDSIVALPYDFSVTDDHGSDRGLTLFTGLLGKL
jgi:hypothetical protein